MSDLYNTINGLCKRENLSIASMCKAIGISSGQISDLKTGRKKGLSAETLSKISKYFGVSVDYLLGLEEGRIHPSLLDDPHIASIYEEDGAVVTETSPVKAKFNIGTAKKPTSFMSTTPPDRSNDPSIISKKKSAQNEINLDDTHSTTLFEEDGATKKPPPIRERPISAEATEIARRLNSLSPENRARALDYLDLLEKQDV